MDKKTIGIIIGIIVVLIGIVAVSGRNTEAPNQSANTNTNATTTADVHAGVDHNNTTASTSPIASTTTNVSGTVSASGEKVFTVTGNNFKFDQSNLTVKKGDKVRIIFKNTGGFHDLVIDEFKVKTKQIQGNAQDEIAFVADKAGTFEYYCSVGNHRQMGMKGTLTVTQ